MTPGDRVGPALLTERLGTSKDVTRFRAEDANGHPVEVLLLAGDVPAELRARFVQVHGTLSQNTHDQVVSTQWTGELDGGAYGIVREWTDLVEPVDSAEQAVSRLRVLMDPVQAAGSALLSTTTARDLRQRAGGQLVVAPWGVLTHDDAPHAAQRPTPTLPPPGRPPSMG